MKHWQVALTLAFAAFVGHHAYRQAPVEVEGHAWNIGGALSRLVLLWVIWSELKSKLVTLPVVFFAAEELQAIGCTLAYIVSPWTIEPGGEKCSTGLRFPLQSVCMLVWLWVVLWLYDKMKGRR